MKSAKLTGMQQQKQDTKTTELAACGKACHAVKEWYYGAVTATSFSPWIISPEVGDFRRRQVWVQHQHSQHSMWALSI